MFKITGFSSDNLIAGISSMGATYVEMVATLTKRLFNWLFNLFDYKVVPNVPNNPPSWRGVKDLWYGKPVEGLDKIIDMANKQDFYRSPVNISASTEWHIPTWVWYTGIAIVSAGLAYLGYKFITDPLFIDNFISSKSAKGKAPFPHRDTTPTPGAPTPDITVSDARTGGVAESILGGVAYINNRVSAFNRAVVDTLNPFNYFTTSTETAKQFSSFMERQNVLEQADKRFYPFTENNPYDSWFKKLRISLTGESLVESADRLRARQFAERVLNSLAVNPEVFETTGSVTPATSVGLGFKTPLVSNSYLEMLNAFQVENKIKSIPATPDVTAEWAQHVKETATDSWNTISRRSYVTRVTWNVPSYSAVKLEDFGEDQNFFKVLPEASA